MKKVSTFENWVIYRATSHGKLTGCAVCEKIDWERMEAANPGHQVLVKTGIHSESEAEWLARDFNAPAAPPKKKRR